MSQKFNDTAVILAIAVSKRYTQDLPGSSTTQRSSTTQASSTGFLFTYH